MFKSCVTQVQHRPSNYKKTSLIYNCQRVESNLKKIRFDSIGPLPPLRPNSVPPIYWSSRGVRGLTVLDDETQCWFNLITTII